MKSYTYYNKDTGEIIGTLTGAAFDYLPQCVRIDGYYPGDQYFMRGTTPTPKKDFKVSVEGNTITNIPIGTKVTARGQSVVVTDGVLEITPIPNMKSKVTLSNLEYKELEVYL